MGQVARRRRRGALHREADDGGRGPKGTPRRREREDRRHQHQHQEHGSADGRRQARAHRHDDRNHRSQTSGEGDQGRPRRRRRARRSARRKSQLARYEYAAIASISTRASFGNRDTWTVARAGYGSEKNVPYTAFTAANSLMSARKIVVRMTFAKERPPALSTASRLFITR